MEIDSEPMIQEEATRTKSKRKISKPSKNAAQELVTATVRKPQWSYFRVELISSLKTSLTSPLDPLTAATHLRSTLTQFLGLTGSAIAIDILKCGTDPDPTVDPNIEQAPRKHGEREVFFRVPREDSDAVAASLGSGWIGRDGGGEVSWRILGRGEWLGGLIGESDGFDLWG